MTYLFDKVLYWIISLQLRKDFAVLRLRKNQNKSNLIRANKVNDYRFCLTLDSNEYKIVDKFSDEHIATLKYRELELIIETETTVSIRQCKDVMRAFFNNPYLQVTVTG